MLNGVAKIERTNIQTNKDHVEHEKTIKYSFYAFADHFSRNGVTITNLLTDGHIILARMESGHLGIVT